MLQNLEGLRPVPVQGGESAVEAYYTNRPLEVRPNIQYVIDPSRKSQNRSAIAFGVKTVASFDRAGCLNDQV